jgi:hypothetical protein
VDDEQLKLNFKEPKNHNDLEDNVVPRLYSKWVILFFSMFGSVVMGALLYARNLKEIGRSNHAWLTVGGAVAYLMLLGRIGYGFTFDRFYQFLPINIIAAVMLVGPMWNFHFTKISDFKVRSFWLPALLLMLVAALFFWLYAT